MANKKSMELTIGAEDLAGLIYTVRGVQVMLDSDLATLYRVETRIFNQAVKRNSERFPDEFRFQLTRDEYEALRSQMAASSVAVTLRSQSVTSSGHGGRRYLPYVFTEPGVAMLSAVLHSATAIQASIRIINAFVAMRRILAVNGGLLQRMDTLEQRQASFEIRTGERFDKVFEALESKNLAPTQGVFFDGQIFDAYVFVNDLLRQARKSIVLIDNYVDDSVLLQLAKRRQGVTAFVLTRNISKVLEQDLKKHNVQHSPIMVHEFAVCHDRFLILDGATVYHLGASLKDLGKKWFAFSKMDKAGLVMIEKVESVLEMSNT